MCARRRALLHEVLLLHEVQYDHMVPYDGTSVCCRMVVREDRRVLPTAGLVWPSDVVAVLPLRASGVRELRRLAVRVQESHQNWRARCEGSLARCGLLLFPFPPILTPMPLFVQGPRSLSRARRHRRRSLFPATRRIHEIAITCV